MGSPKKEVSLTIELLTRFKNKRKKKVPDQKSEENKRKKKVLDQRSEEKKRKRKFPIKDRKKTKRNYTERSSDQTVCEQ